jgi:hypothetical protein
MIAILNFVCFSINYWEKRKDRKHQFMLSLSQKESVGKVLYIEPSMNLVRLFLFPFVELKTVENRHRWWRALMFKVEKIRDKFYVVSPLFLIPLWRFYPIYKINRLFNLLIIKNQLKKLGIRKPVIWLYHPYDECILDFMKGRKASCFDWAELWSEWFIEFSPKRLQFVAELEKRIISKSDVVFTTSVRNQEKAKVYNKNSYFLASGSSSEQIAKVSIEKIPEDIARLSRPRIGYVGSIKERVDLALIHKLSKAFPGGSIIMIGNVQQDRIDPHDFPREKNIYFLGARDYDELPRYLMAFDVGIIPYIPGLIDVEPTKQYDYLIAGIPVVSTDLVEIRRLKRLVKIAKNHKEFIDLVRRSLSETNHKLIKARQEFALNNSWLVRAQEILDILHNIVH